MITEVADIRTPDGQQAGFEEALRRGLDTVLSTAPGFRSYRILAGIESPDRYLLMIDWDNVEDHTVGFRNSALYSEWSAIVRPFFDRPPQVEHFRTLSS
jgi:heme-degrading monooxygenase HmoA